MRVTLVLLLAASLTVLAACSSSDEDDRTPAERLSEHYKNVIVPETEAALETIAESCDIDGVPDPVACRMFTILSGDVDTVRVARYWEAMNWLGVDAPGREILPAFFAIEDDCDNVAVQVFEGDDPGGASSMCGYFRSEQFPPCGSGGSSTLEDNVAGFSRCLRLLATPAP